MLNGTNLPALLDYLAARLDRQVAEPLHRQLYRALRQAIQQGLLPGDTALPASRVLAQTLAVARNTVLHAYEQLCAEGFCQARAGAGTFVAAQLPEPAAWPARKTAIGEALPLSRRAAAWLDVMGERVESAAAAFAPGRPDLAAFPWPVWWRLLQAQQRGAQADDFDYREQGGHPALKQALAGYLQLSRGVVCGPAQVLVCSGMQQALDLLGRALADTGDTVWMEEPGYRGARMAWLATGLSVCPVPVDEEGLDWQGRALPTPRLVYVTPSHQYPLGSVMSLARRQALLAEAARQGAWVVEDDYDGEFRHAGRPLAAMQGLDSSGRVIYLGTFSKVMFPALRLAYLVVPAALAAPLRQLQARLYREGDYTAQAALARFIEEGHFGSHLRRMRGVYARRQAKLRKVLEDELGDALPLLGGEAGMHVTARLPTGWDDAKVSTILAQQGIAAPPLSAYCAGEPPFPGLVLGYAGVDDASLTLAAVRLAQALHGMGIRSSPTLR